jgi:predicted transcriptional regulator
VWAPSPSSTMAGSWGLLRIGIWYGADWPKILHRASAVNAEASGKDLDSTTAAELGKHRVVTCTPDTTIHAAAQLMMEHYVRHLVVEDRNGPVGMISARDILGAYAAQT